MAAPTCSLPEGIGGERNWDYRYTWIRDAAFTLYGLLRIGFTDEASQFMHWLEARCHELNSRWVTSNHVWNRWATYPKGGNAGPPRRISRFIVRFVSGMGHTTNYNWISMGNCWTPSTSTINTGLPISYDLWKHLRRLINWVCDNWHRTDEGVWEVRGGQQHFVYSKLMCWVAVDRGIRLADKRSFPADRDRWLSVRDAIYEEIMAKGMESRTVKHLFNAMAATH